jgi:26S proteasome regulatory subunit T6
LSIHSDTDEQFFEQQIEEMEFKINEKTQNLRRLEAQRNALNAKGTVLCYF